MNTEATVAYEVARDGVLIESFGTYYEAVAYLHKAQPHSISWASEHEGYTITEKVLSDGRWRDLAGVMHQYLVDGAPDEALKAYAEFVDDKGQ
jgi:hypothetical protein